MREHRGPVVVVHGGAGALPEARRESQAEGCRRAAEAGLATLMATGSALEAAIRAVVILENDPAFNAGYGACLTEVATVELDASVMEGTTMRGGGVAALPPFANPVLIAHAVLEEGRHVLYAGEGARRFAVARGFVELDAEALITDDARERLAKHLASASPVTEAGGGTVGAVACDAFGRVAAATSTGGTVGKWLGRVGDSPILGAGTYADDESGAASATGHGESILRFGLTRTACDLLRTGIGAHEAARIAIARFVSRVGGSGGLVLVDVHGDVGLAHETKTMPWSVAREGASSLAGWCAPLV